MADPVTQIKTAPGLHLRRSDRNVRHHCFNRHGDFAAVLAAADAADSYPGLDFQTDHG